MELKSFRVRNFRSINDSGEIDVSRITALLGRNESGKSNILRALHSLNPADGFKPLSPIKDFPRHRKLSECNDNTPAVDSTWQLTKYEQQRLAEIWPTAEGVSEVTVGRPYGDSRYVGIDAPEAAFDLAAIKADARKIDAAVKAKASKLTDDAKVELEKASDAFVAAIGAGVTAAKWATSAAPALAALRQALATADAELTDTQDQKVVALEELAEAIPGNEESQKKARNWIIERLPVFMYLEDYPEIKGHQDIAQFLQRKSEGKPTPADTRVRTHKRDSQQHRDVIHQPPARRCGGWRISSGFRMSSGRGLNRFCRRIRVVFRESMTVGCSPGLSML